MAWTNKPYTSLDDVKAALTTTSTTNDDLLSQFIVQAQAAIDSYLGFSFQTDGTHASPATRTYDGNGREQMLIDRCLDLVQVETQTYSVSSDPDTGALTRTTNTPVDVTGDCVLGPVNMEAGFILERLTRYFPIGKRNIVVKGVFGKSATIPEDITRACTRLAIHYMKQVDANYQDKVGNDQFGRPMFKQQLPADVCQILDRYRPRVFVAR
jgi:hypothetical protein